MSEIFPSNGSGEDQRQTIEPLNQRISELEAELEAEKEAEKLRTKIAAIARLEKLNEELTLELAKPLGLSAKQRLKPSQVI
ncbi:MAG: hypothetical protein LBS60_00270 [Deltaproteobacteria bacterium]|jgi:predicted RNase H-like nuclease (RuvC/YqgF family)|nr:hypothetical protein [Deltaproteobacteria bacterium]